MIVRKFVQEASKLAKKSSDGTYRVVLITEGVGSTGVYSAELMNKSEQVFEGAPSFLNHPIDPSKPHLRPVESIAGRFSNVTAEDGPEGRQLSGDFKPRKEYAEFIDEFQDIVGLSIYCGAEGEYELDEDGNPSRLIVESFDESDPYRSCDIVVAAGRGGRFKRAEESLRAIESSLGTPEGAKPAAEASVEEKEGEIMEEVLKAIEALTASLQPVITFVNESAAAKAGETQSEATAEALETARAEGVKAATESLTAIDAAALPAKIAEGLKAKVLEGKDVTEAIADAKAVLEAAKEAEGDKPLGHVIESAGKPADAITDWSF